MDRSGPPPDSRNHHRLMTARLDVELPDPKDAPVLFELVGGTHRREVCATLLWDGPDHVSEVESWIERCHSRALPAGAITG